MFWRIRIEHLSITVFYGWSEKSEDLEYLAVINYEILEYLAVINYEDLEIMCIFAALSY